MEILSNPGWYALVHEDNSAYAWHIQPVMRPTGDVTRLDTRRYVLDPKQSGGDDATALLAFRAE